MALAQPTGLQVQSLEPLLTVEQSVEEHVPAGTLVTIHQVIDDSASLDPAGTIVAITQVVDDSAVIRSAATLLTALQLVDDSATLRPAQALATLDQSVITLSDRAAETLVNLEQTTRRHAASGALVRLRQSVLSPIQITESPTRILLDDEDITDRCRPAIEITASEGDNRTATVTLIPPSGPISITSYQGRALEIHRNIAGNWGPIFTGTVDVPTYNRDRRTLQLRCSDLRGERLGREDQERLLNLTGGLYSNVTQREEATGEQWVRELMKTVEGSLDYTGAGALRYRPWAVATPRFALGPGDIHHREVALEFATRSEIVNRVAINVAFRWYQRHTFTASIGASIARSGVCNSGECLPAPGQALPTREAALSAANGLSGWRVVAVGAGTPPPSGWYRTGPLDSPVAYITSDVFRETYATSVSASIVRYVSQGMRWTDEITVEAPQSIDQFGAIDGSAMSFSIDTHIDPAVFEETGCYNRPEQDRTGDRSQAIEVAQRMAAKQIRGSHRQNFASFRYKPKGGDLLPVEIGDTISVTSSEVTATGWVSEFRHVLAPNGDRYTDIKLAVSRVDSAVAVTENLAVPDVGVPRSTNPEAQNSSASLTCPVQEESQGGEPKTSGIALDGSITLVAPSIGADKTDELVGEGSTTYDIAIPVNSFTVEVP